MSKTLTMLLSVILCAASFIVASPSYASTYTQPVPYVQRPYFAFSANPCPSTVYEPYRNFFSYSRYISDQDPFYDRNPYTGPTSFYNERMNTSGLYLHSISTRCTNLSDSAKTKKEVKVSEKKQTPNLSQLLLYQVKAGDTMYGISRDFNIPLESLIAFNQISNPNLLSIGQKLRIPGKKVNVELPDGKKIARVLTSTITAYTAGPESTGKTPSDPEYGITYSGVKAREGRTIAVDPKVIPLGTKVFIEGIGTRVAEDIGSAIRGNRIDLFINDLKQALKFGVKKNVKVYVLAENNLS